MRKYFIDNLRWMDVFLLIPYHAAQAFNTWGELNYICFEPNKAISSFIVFFSPFFMPLLFLLAGMSTRYSLKKRTYKQYLIERIKRLMVPFIFGALVFCPILAYIGDKLNFGYYGGFFGHYKIFFTKWTDLSGFDGGFGVGQFWFLYYLFVISLVSIAIIYLINKTVKNTCHIEKTSFGIICLMVVPFPFMYDILSVGGKSFAEYLYIFLIGYYVMSSDKVIEKAEKYRHITLAIGITACITNVYMFIWSGKDFGTLNVIAKAFAEWFMILALIGTGKNKLDYKSKLSAYMSRMSFPYFSLHFLWIVLFQYWFKDVLSLSIVLQFIIPVIFAYVITFICCELCLKVPVLCLFMGIKHKSKRDL